MNELELMVQKRDEIQYVLYSNYRIRDIYIYNK